MKKFTVFTFLVFPLLLLAQIPSYYNDVNLSLSSTALKDELATKIINTHTRFLSYSEVWNASKVTDLDPNDGSQSNVILVYGYNDNDGNYITDRTRSKNANGGNNGTDWNREHSYAKSLGSPNLGTSGPGSDAHHLRPADVTFNGQRGSKKFASGSGHAGNSNGGWYPGNEWKGDIARMMMYMYLRYGNQCIPTGVGLGSSSSTPDAMISLFLQWNAEDPVSQLEKNRNAYHGSTANSFSQGNRNPFIDNPAFATQIWGGPQAEDIFGNGNGGTDTQAPSTPTNVVTSESTQTSITLAWDASTDNIGVSDYDIYRNGSYYNSTSATTFTVTGLTANTSYTFNVKANDVAGNTSNASATISASTQSSGGGTNGNNLFFSEYVEGSSYNKALEIANFTGNTVNLSAYKIKKQSNGSGSWTSGYSLSGQLVNGAVFVIANSNASSGVTSHANTTSSSSEISFNGNDPVGLFKNGVLIDIIGNFNGGSSYFAKDVTLRRKTNVTDPSTTYNPSGEWDSYAQNTFDNLGSHTTNGGGNTSTTDILLEHSFESGWNGWTDGGGDCYRIRSSRSFDGNYSIRIRDNSGTASAMTSSSFDVSAYDNLEVTFNFYSYSMENGEDFWLRYFDGSSWRTIKAYARGTDFSNNTFSAVTANISDATYNFPSNAKFRFQCDASSNADQIYIDNIVVTATSGVVNKSSNLDTLISLNKEANSSFEPTFELDELQIYPNPVSKNTSLRIRAEFDLEGKTTDAQINVINLQGQLVKVLKTTTIKTEFFEQDINLSNLKSGVYFVKISTTNGFSTTKKLIVK